MRIGNRAGVWGRLVGRGSGRVSNNDDAGTFAHCAEFKTPPSRASLAPTRWWAAEVLWEPTCWRGVALRKQMNRLANKFAPTRIAQIPLERSLPAKRPVQPPVFLNPKYRLRNISLLS